MNSTLGFAHTSSFLWQTRNNIDNNKCHSRTLFGRKRESHKIRNILVCETEKPQQSDSNSSQKPSIETFSKQNLSRPEYDSNKLPVKPTEFAYGVSTVATAVVGGPVLSGFAIVFGLLGRETDAPTWLSSLAAIMCAGLADTLARSFNYNLLDSSVIPYILFVFGNVVVASIDFDEYFGVEARVNQKQIENGDEQDEGNNATSQKEQTESEKLSRWDRLFSDKFKDGDT